MEIVEQAVAVARRGLNEGLSDDAIMDELRATVDAAKGVGGHANVFFRTCLCTAKMRNEVDQIRANTAKLRKEIEQLKGRRNSW